MKAAKQRKLEAKGWKIGSVTDFLELSPEEAAYIELKLSLSNSLKERRSKKKLTQVEFARLVNTSQFREDGLVCRDASYHPSQRIIQALSYPSYLITVSNPAGSDDPRSQ